MVTRASSREPGMLSMLVLPWRTLVDVITDVLQYRRRWRHALLDAVQTGVQHHSESEVGVGAGVRAAKLETGDCGWAGRT